MVILTDILEKIKAKNEIPFRPRVETDDNDDRAIDGVQALMKQCWDENPAHRPGAKSLLSALRKLNK